MNTYPEQTPIGKEGEKPKPVLALEEAAQWCFCDTFVQDSAKSYVRRSVRVAAW
jgi:hypothetical protein